MVMGLEPLFFVDKMIACTAGRHAIQEVGTYMSHRLLAHTLGTADSKLAAVIGTWKRGIQGQNDLFTTGTVDDGSDRVTLLVFAL